MNETSVLQDVKPDVLHNLQDYLATHDARYLTEDVVFRNRTTGQVHRGRTEVSAALQQVYHVSFDAHLEVHLLFAHDNQAMMEGFIRGRHIGEFNGIAATGKEVAIPVQAAYTLRDGLISEIRAFLDLKEGLQSLGAQSSDGHTRTTYTVRDAFHLRFGMFREAKELMVDAVDKGLIPNDSVTRVFTDFTGDAYRLILEKGFNSLGEYEQRLGGNMSQPGWQKWYAQFKPLVERSHREILKQVY
ncbi:ester cyclase [Flaviaesturariibacter terrae]